MELLGLICLFLWFANIWQLFSTAVAGLAILKAIGIFIPPLGVVLGFCGFF